MTRPAPIPAGSASLSVGGSVAGEPEGSSALPVCPPSGAATPSADQFERLIQAIETADKASADEMPTEADALMVMFRAWERLKKLGWKEAIYCPKDGTWFDAIEAGSTGIHRCHYEGEWPTGSWWVAEAGDLWPSRPMLWRPAAEDGSRPADPTTGSKLAEQGDAAGDRTQEAQP